MPTRISHALFVRLSIPAWVLATLIATLLAVGALTLLAGSDESVPAAVGTQPAAAANPAPTMGPGTCIDYEPVGHC